MSHITPSKRKNNASGQLIGPSTGPIFKSPPLTLSRTSLPARDIPVSNPTHNVAHNLLVDDSVGNPDLTKHLEKRLSEVLQTSTPSIKTQLATNSDDNVPSRVISHKDNRTQQGSVDIVKNMIPTKPTSDDQADKQLNKKHRRFTSGQDAHTLQSRNLSADASPPSAKVPMKTKPAPPTANVDSCSTEVHDVVMVITTMAGVRLAADAPKYRAMSGIICQSGHWAVGVRFIPGMPSNPYIVLVGLTPILFSTVTNYTNGANAIGCRAAFKHVKQILVPNFGTLTFGDSRVVAFDTDVRSTMNLEENKELPRYLPMNKSLWPAPINVQQQVIGHNRQRLLAAEQPRTYVVLPYKEIIGSNQNSNVVVLHKITSLIWIGGDEFADIDLVLQTPSSTFKYATHMVTMLRHAIINKHFVTLTGSHPSRKNTSYLASFYPESSVVALLDTNFPGYDKFKDAVDAPPPTLAENAAELPGIYLPTNTHGEFWREVNDGIREQQALPDGFYDNEQLYLTTVPFAQINGCPVLPVCLKLGEEVHAAFIQEPNIVMHLPDVLPIFGDEISTDKYSMIAKVITHGYIVQVEVKSGRIMVEICNIKNPVAL